MPMVKRKCILLLVLMILCLENGYHDISKISSLRIFIFTIKCFNSQPIINNNNSV